VRISLSCYGGHFLNLSEIFITMSLKPFCAKRAKRSQLIGPREGKILGELGEERPFS
jgi:hypothetical protein